MTIPTSALVKLAGLGLTPEAAEVVASMLTEVETATRAEAEPGREKARARWRKWKEARPANASQRLQTTANDSKQLAGGAARVEDKTSNSKIEPQEKNTPQAALERVLDAERAAQVVAHRQRLRKPLTPYAAKLLAKQIEACPNAAEAADAMIANGWQGVKPEYMAPRQRAGPAPPKRHLTDLLNERFPNHEPHDPKPSEAPVFNVPLRVVG